MKLNDAQHAAMSDAIEDIVSAMSGLSTHEGFTVLGALMFGIVKESKAPRDVAQKLVDFLNAYEEHHRAKSS